MSYNGEGFNDENRDKDNEYKSEFDLEKKLIDYMREMKTEKNMLDLMNSRAVQIKGADASAGAQPRRLFIKP